MKKILIILLLLSTSCVSRSTHNKNSISKNNLIQSQSQTDSNSTVLGIDSSSVNVFNPNLFSPSEVFGVIIFIILLLCFISLSPHFKKFIDKKRS